MSVDNMSDSVGKKIVEALKMQETENPVTFETTDDVINTETEFNDFVNTPETTQNENIRSVSYSNQTSYYDNSQMSAVDNAFQKSLEQNYAAIDAKFDYPPNVEVLTRLMAKLPAGVSRQTAAIIITQTMEALGIPITSVIQDAKQFQDSLSAKARECQKNIIDFRNQISTLELQAQQYQRQAVKINDIISLFTRNQI